MKNILLGIVVTLLLVGCESKEDIERKKCVKANNEYQIALEALKVHLINEDPRAEAMGDYLNALHFSVLLYCKNTEDFEKAHKKVMSGLK